MSHENSLSRSRLKYWGERGEYKKALIAIDESIGEIEIVFSLFKTAPIGFEDQPYFLNGVCKVKTLLSPTEILDKVEEIMPSMGRIRTFANAPRIIDIDILLLDNEIVESENLIIPDPRMLDRLFILELLYEIAPGVIHPITHKTISEEYTHLKEE